MQIMHHEIIFFIVNYNYFSSCDDDDDEIECFEISNILTKIFLSKYSISKKNSIDFVFF